ncbi:family 27 putative glycoside hydrolase [Corynascus novoguineensis]|uniref:Alpha-galactosidase n=1 Tax=Corynascus novoguineensis TaxID=1126955 RepID=A0AAN7CRY2_9PEZI|nr:family 27 putative glycoside hydrolase [Corynascus novoguineensis]
MRTSTLGLLTTALTGRGIALISPGNTGRLPAMGWNSWNEYHCDINESVFLTTAQKLIDTGLADLGYVYVNIDDCWSDNEKRRDANTQEIIPDYARFPRGISGLADEIHSMGLKVGIYSDAGTGTCLNYPGSLGYENIDAHTFASWGIDYLKYDNCYVPSEYNDEYFFDPEYIKDNSPPGYDWGTSKSAQRFAAMRDALQEQNRTILYSICNWGQAHVDIWGNKTGHSWRSSGDIIEEWTGRFEFDNSWGITNIINQAAFFWNATDFWGHADWDMLEVGRGDLTIEENRSHFALWAAFKSPLILGTPLHDIQDSILEIISNRELIDFNQDPVYGFSASPYKWGYREDYTYDPTYPAEYWSGSSVKGIHVFILNTQDRTVSMTASFSEIPALRDNPTATYLVHDMWTGEDIGEFTEGYTVDVEPHDTIALRISLPDGGHPNPTWSPR